MEARDSLNPLFTIADATTSLNNYPPRRLTRIVVAAIIGVAAAAYAAAFRRGELISADFDGIWLAAKALLAGIDPYKAVASSYTFPFYYPLTAAVVGLPFAVFTRGFAAIAFSGVSAGVLAYAVTGNRLRGLLLLANYPMLEATVHGQWTPLLTASALIPTLGWIAIAKPTSGFAVVAAYLEGTAQGRTFFVNAAFVLAILATSFVFWPSWLGQWLATALAAPQYVPLVLRPGGFLLLAAVFRWRRPEARMLLFLAMVPQTAAQYEALPLILALSSRQEAMLFASLTFAASFLGQASFTTNPTEFAVVMKHNSVVHVVLIYLPVLALIIRRENVGWTPRLFARFRRAAPALEPEARL